ncbi:MAG: methyl coenzyme M reductase-arginine methyltransferase Mmp10 [Methanotrichaceae archaeon]|nr:methyl coenzyme M reductase-arginine methyltransferase Mmp10 [Methanotrichaceae archaeon]
MELIVNLGGRPGLDCRGFCSYCYFKGFENIEPLGCRRCESIKKGCDYCSRNVIGIEPFKPLQQIVSEVSQKSLGSHPDNIVLDANGDLSCYPDLLELVKTISRDEVPVNLEYTSGKGFTRGDEAEALADAGVRRIGFSVFSTNAELRRKYMNDKYPEAVISNLRTFCERCEVYAMVVLIPRLNDGPELEMTCYDLEKMGAKGLILMAFANTRNQGLIFGNEPIMPGVIPYTVEELRRIATEAAEKYSMRVIGTPLWDPYTGAPFALAHHKEELGRLPKIEKCATLITSSVAYPLLSSIFQALGGEVNVVPVKKEIGNLIALEDLNRLDLTRVKERVIVPGMVLAHDKEIRGAFRRDGTKRLVFRGPDNLSVESERSIFMTPRQVLDKELEAFTGLIEDINDLGI